MKPFFTPNITRAGRRVRAATAILLLMGAALALKWSLIAAIALAVSGGFVLFEALRGWCLLRACGIKTRL